MPSSLKEVLKSALDLFSKNWDDRQDRWSSVYLPLEFPVRQRYLSEAPPAREKEFNKKTQASLHPDKSRSASYWGVVCSRPEWISALFISRLFHFSTGPHFMLRGPNLVFFYEVADQHVAHKYFLALCLTCDSQFSWPQFQDMPWGIFQIYGFNGGTDIYQRRRPCTVLLFQGRVSWKLSSGTSNQISRGFIGDFKSDSCQESIWNPTPVSFLFFRVPLSSLSTSGAGPLSLTSESELTKLSLPWSLNTDVLLKSGSWSLASRFLLEPAACCSAKWIGKLRRRKTGLDACGWECLMPEHFTRPDVPSG